MRWVQKVVVQISESNHGRELDQGGLTDGMDKDDRRLVVRSHPGLCALVYIAHCRADYYRAPATSYVRNC